MFLPHTTSHDASNAAFRLFFATPFTLHLLSHFPKCPNPDNYDLLTIMAS